MVFNQIYKTDSRNLTDHLKFSEPLVDLIVTSPPYWDMKNYGDVENQIGYGQSKKNYLEDIKLILKNCFEITKVTGSLWLIVDSYRKNGELELLPLQLADIARDVGWILKEQIIWDKQYSMPWHGKGQMRNVFESIFFFVKSDNYKYYLDRIKHLDEISKWWVDFPERFNPKGKTPTNIWRFPLRRRGTWPDPSVVNHLCPFPTGLVARIIELTTDEGDVVMDPFAGSGIVLAQAEVMNRQYIGFEINPAYVEMYEKEVKKEVAKEWEELKEWRETLGKSRKNFEETILKLRALKYTRKVSQAFMDGLQKDEKEKVKAVICLAEIPESHHGGNPLEVEVWIIGEQNHHFFKNGLAFARERMANAPLTHYQIKAKVYSGRFEDFLRKANKRISKDQFFYLYPTQQPRKFIAEDPLKDWFIDNRLDEVRNGNGTPPMLANIAEDVAWVLD